MHVNPGYFMYEHQVFVVAGIFIECVGNDFHFGWIIPIQHPVPVQIVVP